VAEDRDGHEGGENEDSGTPNEHHAVILEEVEHEAADDRSEQHPDVQTKSIAE
jgi:hypothetical protein